jgi:two-component system copper resistance phosphate regulon response regulator CusR
LGLGILSSVRILLAEDDRQLRRALARGLREASYAVDEVGDCTEALARAKQVDYDAVILDVLMPGGDGISVCRVLRQSGRNMPVLILTARDAVDDRIAGLDAGADDYLTKPFDFGELLARLRALTRRRGEVLPSTIMVGELALDTLRRTAQRAGRDIELTAKEYAFLEYLVRNSDRLVTRAEIAAHVWAEGHAQFSNVIDVYAARLRRKIDEGEQYSLLNTQRGVGFILAVPERPKGVGVGQKRPHGTHHRRGRQ